nr:RuBisCO long chain, Form III-like [uncultured archaeon]
MAVQFDYLAPKGWKPKYAEHKYLITLLKVELSKEAIKEARGKKSLHKIFEEAAASIAAESSTGTWTKVYDGKDSGIPLARRLRAMAYDLDYKNHMFKVAYPVQLFEKNNLSGLLAGIVGNIAGMKMVHAMRVFDLRFPKPMIKAFLGPKYGVSGVRKILKIPRGPLLATVPKPKIGRNAKEQAHLAELLFTSGKGSYDGIKDDENLTSLYFNNFYDRTQRVLHILQKAEKKTGKKKFYLANATHSQWDEMIKRAEYIKKHKGIYMMMDVVCTGITAVDSIRRKDLGLAIHAHRAMHGFMTRDNSSGVHGKGNLEGFSISMIVLAKWFRLLGVDNLHGGSPLAKMEDYGEAKYIQEVLQHKETKRDAKIPSLGQKWYHIKPVWMVASGGLHPGDFEEVIKILGEDIVIQCGGGLLGHPEGIARGVEAIEEARDSVMKKIPLKEYVKKNPDSALAAAVKLWGYGPRIVY